MSRGNTVITSVRAKAAIAAPADRKALRIEDDGSAAPPRLVADCCVTPALHSASVVQTFAALSDPDLTELVTSIKTKIATVQGGDLAPVEAMLFGQAEALQSVFTSLTKRAALNMGEYIGAADTYLRLALRAQAQCRATLETLAAIKNPPVFARQANISHGPQQVNNDGRNLPNGTRARGRLGGRSNELSGTTHEKCQNFGDTPTQ